MEIKLYQVEKIIKTLPISYYLFKGLKVEVKEDVETSYTIPSEGIIVIALKNIQDAMKDVDYISPEQFESDCRTILYHEVSHCLLTPNIQRVEFARYFYDKQLLTQLFNIFEDERIETILKDYYNNVDFDGFKRRALEDSDTPTTTLQKFFKVVRFRNYKPEIYNPIVEKIINTFSFINSYTLNPTIAYIYAIKNLYMLIENEPENNVNNESNEVEQDRFDKDLNQLLQDFGLEANTFKDKMAVNNKEAIEDSIDLLHYHVHNRAKKMNKIIEKAILQSLRKKGNQSTSINGYCGRLNTRLVATDEDYKWWTHSSQNGIWKNNSSLHINLFIDTSGSFINNLNKVNDLIGSLHLIQSKYKGFTFRVFGIGSYYNTDVFDQSKNCTFIPSCPHGSLFAQDIENIFKKNQLRNTTNYNILLMDGDFSELRSIGKRTFNKPNVFVVSDYSNQSALKAWKQAHVTLTCDYTKELIDNVTKIINQMVA